MPQTKGKEQEVEQKITNEERARGWVNTGRAGEILGFSGHHVALEVKAGRLTADRTTLAPRSRLRVTVASIEAYLTARAARAGQPTPSLAIDKPPAEE